MDSELQNGDCGYSEGDIAAGGGDSGSNNSSSGADTKESKLYHVFNGKAGTYAFGGGVVSVVAVATAFIYRFVVKKKEVDGDKMKLTKKQKSDFARLHHDKL